MTRYSGRQARLGMAKESTRGTPATPVFWVPFAEMSFDDKVEKFRVQSSIGTLEDSEQAHVLTKWAEGDISGEVRHNMIGLFLKAMLGTVNTSGPTDQAYTHTFTLADSAQHQSLTFVVKDPNTTDQYALVMLQSLEFTQALDGVLNYTATFMGKTSKQTSATTGFTAESKFSKNHVSFKLAGSTALLSSASPISLKSLTLTLSQALVRDDALGSAEPEDFNNTNLSVQGEFSLNYSDEVYKEYMRENSYRAMELKWTNSDQFVNGGSTRPSITFTMPKVDFFDWEPNYALDELVSQKLSFKANRDLATQSDMITVTLVNGVSGSNY